MNPFLGLFTLCCLGLAGAVMVFLDSNRQARVIEPPGDHTRPATLTLQVDLPPIASMDHYYGGEDDSWAPYNPFLPPERRQRELQIHKDPPPPPPPPTNQDRNPQHRVSPPPPPELPPMQPLALSGRKVPQVIGGLIQRGEHALLIQHQGDYALVTVGEQTGNWILQRIGENSAYFAHADDQDVIRVAIGLSAGSTAMQGQSPSSNSNDNATGNNSSTIGAFDLNDPAVQEFLRSRPRLQQMVRDNPERAEAMLEMIMGGDDR